MKSFFVDLLSVSVSKVVVIAFGIGYTIITARYLGPDLNGTIAALIVYPTLFMTVGSLGIRQSTAYFIGKGEFTELSIKKAVVQLWYVSSIFCIISSFLLIKFFSNSGDDNLLIFLAIAPIPFTLFITYNSGIFLGKNEVKQFNTVNWIPAFIKFISVIVLIIVFPFSIYGAMISAILAPLVMNLILLRHNDFIQGFSRGIEIKTLKALLSLGLVYATALLIINLNYKLDVILLDKMSTMYETGIYSKSAQLVEYLWEIPMLLSTIVFARSANSKDNDAFSQKVVQLLRVSSIIVGVCCIILILIAEPLITFLFGQEFKPSALVLIYLLPGVLLLTIFKVLNMDIAGRGKPWLSMKAMIPALIINIALNVVFIPNHGAIGAAIASTVSYSLAAVLFLFMYGKETGIKIPQIMRFSITDFDPIINILKNVIKR